VEKKEPVCEECIMTRIVIDASLQEKLKQLGTDAELCDDAGNVFGRFVPLIDLSVWEPVSPEASEEELDRREQSTEWYTTEQVLQRLRN
jgi:hypothetical protein